MFPLSCSSVPENDNYRSFRFVCRFPRRYCLVLPSVLFCFLWFVSFLLLCQQRSSTREWLAIWGLCSLLKIAYIPRFLLVVRRRPWARKCVWEAEGAPASLAFSGEKKRHLDWTKRNRKRTKRNVILFWRIPYILFRSRFLSWELLLAKPHKFSTYGSYSS